MKNSIVTLNDFTFTRNTLLGNISQLEMKYSTKLGDALFNSIALFIFQF